ncbi:MAG: hypothetical protein ABI851_13450 [Saprospiraceae bacterium]
MVRISILAILMCILNANAVCAQSIEIPNTIRKGVIYKNERSFDLGIQTNGYYFGYNRGKISKYYLTKYLHMDLGHLKDSRELKINQSNISSNLSGNYTYGKQNDLWNIRVGRGLVRYYSEKARKKGVAIGLRMEAGLLVGLIKPYYLQVRERRDNVDYVFSIRYSEERKDQFLNKENILGASGFRYGFGQLSVIPGAFGRIGLSFDPGAFEKMVRALNFGLSLDVYSKKVPILITQKNRFIFANFFLNIQFGKRN